MREITAAHEQYQDTTTHTVRQIEIWWHVRDEPFEGVRSDWVVTSIDEQGNQIGEAGYYYTKMHAIEQAKRFATEYDQDIRIVVAKTKSNEMYKILNLEASAPYKNRYSGTITEALLWNGLRVTVARS